jgi:hypothetical protein
MAANATLMTHCGAVPIDFHTLSRIKTPPATSSWKPVPHAHFVEALLQGLDRRGMRVDRAQYAVSHLGMRLFGVMKFGEGDDYERCLGFRASNDKTFPLQIVAGLAVFVCDNLALSGDVVALKRKHTSGLDLDKEVAAGIDSYLLQQAFTEKRVARLKEIGLSETGAKAAIYDLLQQRVIPSRLLQAIHQAYFEPQDTWLDCKPRTLWGLHNACTRVAKRLDMSQQFAMTLALGGYFNL